MASADVETNPVVNETMETTSTTSTENRTKTQESIEAKGDKSYYYWHKYVSKTVPISPPPLLSKTTIDTSNEIAYKKISNYLWMDDDARVKVYVEFAKIGDSNEAAEMNKDNVQCSFGEQSFELKVHNYRGNHHLKISNLREEIDAEASTFKVLASKILITLKKKDASKSWHELAKK